MEKKVLLNGLKRLILVISIIASLILFINDIKNILQYGFLYAAIYTGLAFLIFYIPGLLILWVVKGFIKENNQEIFKK